VRICTKEKTIIMNVIFQKEANIINPGGNQGLACLRLQQKGSVSGYVLARWTGTESGVLHFGTNEAF